VADLLKPASIAILLVVIFITPEIQDRLAVEASRYVDDNESSHDGLPKKWVEKQTICVFFPEDYPHQDFSQGVTMIDQDGETIGINEDFFQTGACIGGFNGYTDGMDFMMDSTRAARGKLSVGYEVGEWGPFVHTIGGLNANSVTGDFGGAYWNLDHNDGTSMVGIGDLVMSEGDVISWSIGTW
tara:strand:- start:111 stop:662 length:552 start_codon:yes stop_codon:yes gene_type:complete